MPPTLKKTSSLDEVYKQFNGDINLFLKSKQHTNDESLVLQVKKELSQKGLLEIKMLEDKQELWKAWFSLKQSMIADMEKQAEKAAFIDHRSKEKKEKDESYTLNLEAYQEISRAQNSLNQQSPTPASNSKTFAPKQCSGNLNELIRNKVVSQEFVDKLLTKSAQGDKQAAKNLEYLTNGTVWNINKNQFQKTGMADETLKNQEDFHNFNSLPGYSALEKNAITQKAFGVRRVVFQCTEQNPAGNSSFAEARNINNIIKRFDLMLELQEKTKRRDI